MILEICRIQGFGVLYYKIRGYLEMWGGFSKEVDGISIFSRFVGFF